MPRESYVYDRVTRQLVPKAEWSALQASRAPRRAMVQARKVERGSWVMVDGELVPKHEYAAGPRRSDGLQVIRDIEPYRDTIEGKVIGGRKQHRDFLRAHGVIETGNERMPERKPYRPRSAGEDVKIAGEKLGYW